MGAVRQLESQLAWAVEATEVRAHTASAAWIIQAGLGRERRCNGGREVEPDQEHLEGPIQVVFVAVASEVSGVRSTSRQASAERLQRRQSGRVWEEESGRAVWEEEPDLEHLVVEALKQIAKF